MTYVGRMGFTVAVWAALSLMACGEDDARIEVPGADEVAQSVPNSLVRQIAQRKTGGVPGQAELVGFFSRGTMSDGSERFMVVRVKQGGSEEVASIVYHHGREALQGCEDAACERKAPAIAFSPVAIKASGRGVRAMAEPTPACIVEFYTDANYQGLPDCYSDDPPSYAGTWYLNFEAVVLNDAFSSHKTYDQLCREQGIETCTFGGYLIDVRLVMVWRHADYDGYDRQLHDYASDYSKLRWCDWCGTINDEVSSFSAKVVFW